MLDVLNVGDIVLVVMELYFIFIYFNLEKFYFGI